eukprot:SAG31_NODE_1796_length_7245_cov_57.374195_2_plen_49_part_00
MTAMPLAESGYGKVAGQATLGHSAPVGQQCEMRKAQCIMLLKDRRTVD